MIGIVLAALLSSDTPPVPDFASPEGLEIYKSSDESYRACIKLLAEDTAAGAEGARSWMFSGGGAPAMHCVAVADLALGRPRLAAVRLLELSERRDVGPAGTKATVLAEAALAWLDAEEPEFAVEAIETAIDTEPTRVDLQVVAAKAYASAERWQAASDAVDFVEAANVETAEIFLIRARAMRALGKNQEAAEDVVRTLKIDPFNLDALVLRGELVQSGIYIAANYAPKDADGEGNEFGTEGGLPTDNGQPNALPTVPTEPGVALTLPPEFRTIPEFDKQ
ncbi:MAG: hypothetical protein AAF668_12090 [Pseudomonadota bacterium]